MVRIKAEKCKTLLIIPMKNYHRANPALLKYNMEKLRNFYAVKNSTVGLFKTSTLCFRKPPLEWVFLTSNQPQNRLPFSVKFFLLSRFFLFLETRVVICQALAFWWHKKTAIGTGELFWRSFSSAQCGSDFPELLQVNKKMYKLCFRSPLKHDNQIIILESWSIF